MDNKIREYNKIPLRRSSSCLLYTSSCTYTLKQNMAQLYRPGGPVKATYCIEFTALYPSRRPLATHPRDPYCLVAFPTTSRTTIMLILLLETQIVKYRLDNCKLTSHTSSSLCFLNIVFIFRWQSLPFLFVRQRALSTVQRVFFRFCCSIPFATFLFYLSLIHI